MKKMVIDFGWTFLFSAFLFYAADIDTIIYLCIIAVLWLLICMIYSIGKNKIFYKKMVLIFGSNFITFVLLKYLKGYQFLLDCEDKICIAYALGLIGFCIFLFVTDCKKCSVNEGGKKIFRERKLDLERLLEYMPLFPIIGVNGAWGSGKSFVVDCIENSEYYLVKIDLLSCNLDEIQMVLLGELEKVLKENGIFSPYSPKLRRIFTQDNFIQRMSMLVVSDEISYSEALKGFRQDLSKLKKTLVIVYEDLDRIESVDIIKKILGISEKLAGGNIKIIYQYDEQNLKLKEIDEKYLEKYIPFTIRLTELSFSSILDYLFEENADERFPLERSDFDFLERPVTKLWQYDGVMFNEKIPNVTIRKVEHFLNEIIYFINKGGIYEENKREVILFFLLKHFFYDIYAELVPGKSVLDVLHFSYEERTDNIINWFQYCCRENQNIDEIFLKEENRLSALLVSLFQYEYHIDEISNNLDDILNESSMNIEKRNINEKKDRLIWNLLCNGKSEYTNQKVIVDLLQREVLCKPVELQEQAFEELWLNIYYKKYDVLKRDNGTIFFIGVPRMFSLFQACRVAGITGNQWIAFLEFYFEHERIKSVIPELIENLNYCDLRYRELYLYIIKRFNKLQISKNMNEHKAYWTFLDNYLSGLSRWGYVNTEEVSHIRHGERKQVPFVVEGVINPLKEKLEGRKQEIPFSEIKADIDSLLAFLNKNKNLMQVSNAFEKPKLTSEVSRHTVQRNQTSIDRLNALVCDDEKFHDEVVGMYKKGQITAYEISKLERVIKNKQELL